MITKSIIVDASMFSLDGEIRGIHHPNEKRPSFMPSRGKGTIVFVNMEGATPYAVHCVLQIVFDRKYRTSKFSKEWNLGKGWKAVMAFTHTFRPQLYEDLPLIIRNKMLKQDVSVYSFPDNLLGV